MKILQLCRKFPYPLKDGEAIAVTYLAKGYKSLGADLTLLSFNTIKHYFDIADLPAEFDHYQAIYTTFLDNHPTIGGAFLNLFSEDSYHISRFINTEFEEQLERILKERDFDFIQLESVYLAPYIPIIRQYSDALLVMRAHNVEFEIWERVAANTSSFFKKWYINYLAKKLRKYEINQLVKYDLLLAMTKKDRDYFGHLGYRGESMIVPIGLQIREYSMFEVTHQPVSISFLGSLDWIPNQEGLKWFLKEVWPIIFQEFPTLEFHIAGRNTPKWIFQLAKKGIIVHGEVADAKSFLRRHPVTIVPLFSGSGMRVKILEGMALGSVVVTTTVGVEGIEVAKNHHVLIADSAEDFVKQLRYCITYPQKVLQMRKRAKDFIKTNYDNDKIAAQVLEVIEAAIRG